MTDIGLGCIYEGAILQSKYPVISISVYYHIQNKFPNCCHSIAGRELPHPSQAKTCTESSSVLMLTDYYSGPGRATGLVCVCVCFCVFGQYMLLSENTINK